MSTRPSVVDSPKREAMRIAGEKVYSDRVIDVCYPWTGEVVATVPRATADDVRRAISIARQYKPRLTRHERYRILMKAGDIIAARRDAIARLITLESGLCLKDTTYEVGRASDVLLFSAQQALVDDGQSFACDLTHHGKSRRVHTMREPMMGVISAITPFNHPLNQVIHKVAPSIATNNRMVLKPTEKTPLAAILLADVLYEAGLPPEMLSVVTGDPKEIADEMLTHEHVDVVTFTGGVAIGKSIAAKAVYKRQILELGGNDPLVVMDDADIAKAADLAANGSYKNSGQRCTAVKRIFVHEKIAADFTDALLAKTQAWSYGDPLDPSVDMGTVIDEGSARLFERRVDDAVAQGARLLHGNRRDGASYAPTLIDRVQGEMEVVKQETFGPVSPVITFKDVDDAIAQVNSTAYGLSSGVCTNRLDDVMRFVRELNVGSVNLWEVPGYRLEVTPFGGIKDSGTGVKEGVQECCKAFTNVKTYSLPW
jgi:putative phosphonoacetaldehyde dehydrogenase